MHYFLDPQKFKTIELTDYTELRMHHYRKPNLPSESEIKFVLDNTIKNKLLDYSYKK